LTCGYRKRADLSNAFTPGRPPSLVCNRQQPQLSERLGDGAANSFCCFSLGPGGVDIEVPKGLWLIELPDGLISDDPTPDLAGPLSNWSANLRRRFLASYEQYGTR
jgi:hypothetical protein